MEATQNILNILNHEHFNNFYDFIVIFALVYLTFNVLYVLINFTFDICEGDYFLFFINFLFFIVEALLADKLFGQLMYISSKHDIPLPQLVVVALLVSIFVFVLHNLLLIISIIVIGIIRTISSFIINNFGKIVITTILTCLICLYFYTTIIQGYESQCSNGFPCTITILKNFVTITFTKPFEL